MQTNNFTKKEKYDHLIRLVESPEFNSAYRSSNVYCLRHGPCYVLCARFKEPTLDSKSYGIYTLTDFTENLI